MIITDPKQIPRDGTVVATSGYYDPLHVGHLECLELSKKMGDLLVVIVNNDAQAALKKGKSFMPESERVKIIDGLRCVDYVFLSIDEDQTVVKSLAAINPTVFTKGGDRFAGEIPEATICRALGIRMVDGLGSKIQSSSSLIAGDGHKAIKEFFDTLKHPS
jgi:D-beta-D-heptose 7-phosphate kinase/D-beta-D-heptose 1-phosphate adenosyltransferase